MAFSGWRLAEGRALAAGGPWSVRNDKQTQPGPTCAAVIQAALQPRTAAKSFDETLSTVVRPIILQTKPKQCPATWHPTTLHTSVPLRSAHVASPSAP